MNAREIKYLEPRFSALLYPFLITMGILALVTWRAPCESKTAPKESESQAEARTKGEAD